MTRTALDLSREEWRTYQPGKVIARRREKVDARLEARWQRASHLAQLAAQILRKDFGAEKVVLFGSSTSHHRFTNWSDVDLAAWGIPDDRFFSAVAAVSDLSPDIKIDLVDPEICSPNLREVIEQDGVEL
jgi:predicted nucleotidyltransferase